MNKGTCIVTLSIVFAFGATSATAQSDYIVTATARTEGVAGTHWLSEGCILNPTANEVTVKVDLWPGDHDNTSLPYDQAELALPAGRMACYDDLLSELFGVVEDAGSLHVSSQDVVLISTRTFNEGETGTFGQLIRGVDLSHAHPAQTEVFLPGFNETDDPTTGYRSNLGLVNSNEFEIAVTISFYNHDGRYLTGFADRLPTRAFKQYTRVLGSFAPVVNAYAIITCNTPDATFFSYQSQIDMVTGDPVYRHGRVLNTFDTVYIAAGARTEGLEGTSWATDMVVLNRSGSEQHLRFELWLRNRANFSPLSESIALADGQQVMYADVLGTLFGIDEGSAALCISGAEGVLIDSRTYSTPQSENGGTGTYGQYIAAVPEYGNVLVPGGEGYNLACIEDSAAGNSFRTNIGFLNVALDPAKLKVVVHDASGLKLGEKVYSLPVKGYKQISRVLEDILGAAGESITDAYLRYTLVSSTGRVLGYRSTIDNSSGDPVFEPAWMFPDPDCVPVAFVRGNVSPAYGLPPYEVSATAEYYCSEGSEGTEKTNGIPELVELSFDGARTWQSEPSYTVTDIGERLVYSRAFSCGVWSGPDLLGITEGQGQVQAWAHFEPDGICPGNEESTLHYGNHGGHATWSRLDGVDLAQVEGTIDLAAGAYRLSSGNDVSSDSVTVALAEYEYRGDMHPNLYSDATLAEVGDEVRYWARRTGGTGPLSYLWTFKSSSGQVHSTSTSPEPEVTYTVADTYSSELQLTDSCGNSVHKTGPVVEVVDECEPFEILSTSVHPLSGTWLSNSFTVTVQWTGTATQASRASITLRVDGVDVITREVTTSPTRFTTSFTETGDYTFSAAGSNFCGSDTAKVGTVTIYPYP